MSKKTFGKNKDVFQEVGKISETKGKVPAIVILPNDKLVDYPNNIEIGSIDDLKASISEQGFTTPIEITNFGHTDDRYTIVSGHRRREAGVSEGYTHFPCIIRDFKNKNDLEKAVLLGNNQRDTSKHPGFMSELYNKTFEYLTATSYKGDKGKETARLLGLSRSHGDRYSQFRRIIEPIKQLVYDEILGMSSVTPLCTLSPEEQEDLLNIFTDCIERGISLNRNTVKTIELGYKAGYKTYDDILNADPRLFSKSKNNDTKTEESKDAQENFVQPPETEQRILPGAQPNVNNLPPDISSEVLSFDANDKTPRPVEDEVLKESDQVEEELSEESEAISSSIKDLIDKTETSSREEANGIAINKCLEKSLSLIDQKYLYSSLKDTEEAMEVMGKTVVTLLEELHKMSTGFCSNVSNDDVEELKLLFSYKIKEIHDHVKVLNK